MAIAERLYIQGYISYPRTETSQYPENFDIKSLVKSQKSHCLWGCYCSDLLTHEIKRPEGGKDAGDHPPITPTEYIVHEDELDDRAWRLYDLVVRYFIASISSNCQYIRTKAQIDVGNVYTKPYICRNGFLGPETMLSRQDSLLFFTGRQ